MRAMVVALATVVLTGCAGPSMQEMRERGAAHVFTSSKSEDLLSKCILFAWQDGHAIANVQPGRTGGTTVYSGGNEYFVDLKADGKRTSVEYYEVGNSWISKQLLPKVQSCL
ncbi:hypothetical protein [Pseudomonas bohemica]|uniref:hypothetical protein n=1 Tax=Pseudomonas bohemica TaxID=2044872 RepID=UPI0018FE7E8F|nr:hypothetical protein [Pseudomonas bohemica]